MQGEVVADNRLCPSERFCTQSELGGLSSQSGGCTRVADPRLYLPREDERLQQKQRIITAFKEWNLSFRLVSPGAERDYLDSDNKEPRPVYMVAEDVSVATRSQRTLPDSITSTVGVIDLEPICAYKRNATTSELVETNRGLDALTVKCLPNLDTLQDKMREQAHRQGWEVYEPFTSGHLAADGTFTLPKRKSSSKLRQRPVPHSELLTVGYEKNQIVCYSVNKGEGDITAELEKKRQLEQSLALDSLPIALYSEESGTVQVYFEEELLPSITEFERLKESELLLDEYAGSLSVDPIALRKVLKLLTWPQKIDSFNALRQNYVTPAQGLPTVAELVYLVSNPEAYSAEKLRQYFDRGAKINVKVFYKGEYRSLIWILVDTELERARTRRKNPGCDVVSYDACSANALALFQELCRCGVTDTSDDMPYVMFYKVAFSEAKHLYDSVCASGYRPDIPHNYCGPLYYSFPMGAGGIVSIDACFSAMSTGHLQSHMRGLLTRPFQSHRSFPANYQQHLMMLFHYGADPRPFLDELLEVVRVYREIHVESDGRSCSYRQMCGDRTPEEYIDYIRSLWERRQSNALFTGWPEKVSKARSAIEELKRNIVPCPISAKADQQEGDNFVLKTLTDTFAKPPILGCIGDTDETIFKILQHYYRRPGPERVPWAINQEQLPKVWKRSHNCSHVVRTRNNAHWYMQLLEQFRLAQFSDEEKALLGLAAIYHDASSEDVDKRNEEQRSAYYFMRDCKGHFDEQLLAQVARALECKEDDRHNKEGQNREGQLRNCIRVLRFADRMDFVRCSNVGADFPAWNRERGGTSMNVDLLDIPPCQRAQFSSDPAQKTSFQRALEACMHGAVDLASVTGGCSEDERSQNSYPVRYQLDDGSGEAVMLSFERTCHPLIHMDRFIDDNVRRKVAARAGIVTCRDPEHRVCQADIRKGVTRGIHNSLFDLGQVQLPSGMTLVEKMQCEYDFDLLRQEIREALQEQIDRLKREGISMNTGTLTQQTLKSAEAVKVLSERGIAVVESDRRRGYDESGLPKWERVLVPIEKEKSKFPE